MFTVSDKENAVRFKKECMKGNYAPLDDFLNELFKHNSIAEQDVVITTYALISVGLDFGHYEKEIKRLDHSSMCNKPLGDREKAYRCYTCGTTPHMTLCEACFESVDHTGHETKIYMSTGHGSCDCGNPSALNPNGFCGSHGPNKDATPVPREMVVVAEHVIPRVLRELLLHCRENLLETGKHQASQQNQYAPQWASPLNMMTILATAGDTLLNFLAKVLTDEEEYKLITSGLDPESKDGKVYQKFLERKPILGPFPGVCEQYKDRFENMTPPIEYKTMLEEFVYFLSFYCFDFPLNTLLIHLFGNEEFKHKFAEPFVRHYPQMICRLQEEDAFSSEPARLVLISTQLYVFENTAMQLVKEHNMLFMIALCMQWIVEMDLEDHLWFWRRSDGQEADPGYIDKPYPAANILGSMIQGSLVKDHSSTLYTMFAYPSIVNIYLQDFELQEMLIKTFSYFQGIHMNVKMQKGRDVFDPETYTYIFGMEDRALIKLAGKIVKFCKDQCRLPYVMKAIERFRHYLEVWFDAINLEPDSLPHRNRITFHLPLHRGLAIFTKTALTEHGVSLDDILTDGPFLRRFMKHVVHVQVTLAEMAAKRWWRNGDFVAGQRDMYVLPCFLKLSDNDMYLLQLCAMQVDPDYFVMSVMKGFGLYDWVLNLDEKQVTEPDTFQMLESLLEFFTTILGLETTLETDRKQKKRKDVAAILAADNFGHNDLMKKLPQRSDVYTSKKQVVDEVLKEQSDFKLLKKGLQPHSGFFVPTATFWDKHYDPVATKYRLREQTSELAALDRYRLHLRANKGCSVKEGLWPPFRVRVPEFDTYKRLFRIVNCRTMHAFLFAIIHKTLTQSSIARDKVLYHALHLLTAAAHSVSAVKQPPPPPPPSPPQEHQVWVNQLSQWFTSGDIRENACHVVESVSLLFVEKEPEIVYDFPDKDKTTFYMPEVPDADKTAKTFPINESLISLLFKLRARLAGAIRDDTIYKPLSQKDTPPLPEPIDGGTGPKYIGRLLDFLYTSSPEAAKLIDEQVCAQSEAKAVPAPDVVEEEDRHKKAKKARERNMALMASQQKEFEKKAEDTKEMEQDPDLDSDSEMPEDSSSTRFHCTVCKSTEESTAEHPIGLLVNLQVSGVLGNRKQAFGGLPKDCILKGENENRCNTAIKERQQVLTKHFSKSSCNQAVNPDWDTGVVVQTCGHYGHLECIRAYQQSQPKPRQYFRQLVPSYKCPMCRQKYQEIIPIMPKSRPAVGDSSSGLTVTSIKNLLQVEETEDVGLRITAAMKFFQDSVELFSHIGLHPMASSAPVIEDKGSFFSSIPRTNLEVEIIKAGGTLTKGVSGPSSRCYGPLFRVLRHYVKKDPGVHASILDDLAGEPQSEEEAVPVLMRDPVSMLLHLMLGLPDSTTQDHYDFLVGLLFKVAYVSASLNVETRLSQDEQRALLKGLEQASDKKYPWLASTLQWMIRAGKRISAAHSSQDTWSIDRVEALVKLYCLPFLRIAALLRRNLFDVDIPTMKGKEDQEFEQLCIFLQIKSPEDTVPDQWFLGLQAFAGRNSFDTKLVLQANTRWLQPDFILLPENFFTMYNKLRSATCTNCHDECSEPALCIICGEVMCQNSTCKPNPEPDNHEPTSRRHAISCCHGTGLYVTITTGNTFIQRNPRDFYWGSLYLDEFGEEDLKFHRGRQLYLCEERVEMLRQEWINHSFDAASDSRPDRFGGYY